MIHRIQFENLEELQRQCIKDGACTSGLEWLGAQDNLEQILATIPADWRVWALGQGYSQFEEHCAWGELDGDAWSWLLQVQPQYVAQRPVECHGEQTRRKDGEGEMNYE